MTFQLHPQLSKDCIEIGKFDLCRLLLMNDSQFPWLILVPEVAGITEIYQLTAEQRKRLIEESSFLAKTLQATYRADKLNIAAIGNLVSQLHVHHIVRYRSDKAWPAPVWGKFAAVAYTQAELAATIKQVSKALNLPNSVALSKPL